MYSKEVIEQFLHPKNMGGMENADGVGTVGNIMCGDQMTLYIKIKNDVIADIKFESFGCAAAIATSSMITEMAKGKTIEEAERLTRDDVAKELGGLPPIKIHCSNMAAEALKKAIEDYRSKK
ncbi:MAG: iron-sulfur cluster assembly scaffold protein [bacterium]